MTLEDLYYIGQIVAVIVMVATLVAILFHGYQTNKIARAELTLTTWLQTGFEHAALVNNPEKAEFMHRALFGKAALSEPGKIRLGNLLGLAIGTHEAAFNLLTRGLVETVAYERIAGFSRLYLQRTRVRKWWRTRREYGYDPHFRDVIDAMAKEFDAVKSARRSEQELKV